MKHTRQFVLRQTKKPYTIDATSPSLLLPSRLIPFGNSNSKEWNQILSTRGNCKAYVSFTFKTLVFVPITSLKYDLHTAGTLSGRPGYDVISTVSSLPAQTAWRLSHSSTTWPANISAFTPHLLCELLTYFKPRSAPTASTTFMFTFTDSYTQWVVG